MGGTTTVIHPIFLWQWESSGNTAKVRRTVYSTVGCMLLTPNPGGVLRFVAIRFKNRCIRHQPLQRWTLRQHVLLTTHVTGLELQIRNLEVAVVWHCEQVMEESTANQWCNPKTDCDCFSSDLSLSKLFLSDLSLLRSQRYTYSTGAAYHLYSNMTVHININKKGEAMFSLLRVRYW